MKGRKQSASFIVLMAICAALLFALFRAAGSTSPNSASQPLQSSIETPPIPIMTAMGTVAAEGTAITEKIVLTLTPPLPTPLPTVPDGRRCYIDSVNGFSVLLGPGWYIDPVSGSAPNTASILWNTDPTQQSSNVPGARSGEGDFAPGQLKIQINSVKVQAEQSLGDWVKDLIARNTSKDAPIPTKASTPTSYSIGRYTGLAYTFESGISKSFHIALSVDEARILLIAIWPADSKAMNDGLALMSTLDTATSSTCK